MNHDSQTLQLQRWMAQGKSITPLEALRRFNCLRLGARCWDLKKAGWPVKSTRVDVGGKKVASYSFETRGKR